MVDKIPQGWRKIELKDCLSESTARNKTGSSFPVLSVTNTKGFVLQDEQFSRKIHSKDTKNYKIVSRGQFAYNPSRINVGSIARLEKFENGLLSPMYIVFSVDKDFLPELFVHFITSYNFSKKVLGSTEGTVRDSLSFKALCSFSINLPSLPEQEKIAEILTAVDENIKETDNIISECECIKKGMMQTFLTKGIPNRHKKFKKTEIGEMPEDWELLPLHKHLESCQYGITKPLTVEKTGFPCLRMNNLFEGEIDTSDLKYIKLSQKEFENYRLFDGDILFNRTNSFDLVGKVSIFRGSKPMVFAGYLIRLKTNKKMVPEFLNLYMNSELGKGIIRRLITLGVSQANINAKNLQRIPVPVPAIDEQNKIADTIVSINKKMKFEKEKSAKLIVLKKSLMQKLLSGEMRVKV